MNLDLETNYELMLSNILARSFDYLTTKAIGRSSMVIGLSGGIDSSLTAALARLLATDLGMKVIGCSMPIETNEEDELARGRLAGAAFCDDFTELDMLPAYRALYANIRGPRGVLIDKLSHAEKVQRGNMKARVRMANLYDLAHRHSGLVLSTDNLTELLLGFWTLHGDVGDFGMIQSIWKTEVYGMASFLARRFENEMQIEMALALRRAVAAKPTDGLGVSNSDLDQLMPDWASDHRSDYLSGYRSVDQILIEYFNSGRHPNHPVIERHLSSQFKRENPYNIPRDQIVVPMPLTA